MTNGKLASQAGHAFLDCFTECIKRDPDRADDYKRDSMGTKVVLGAKNDQQLLQAYEQAKQKGLPCALIIDSGHIMLPHFDGSPIITALGIGPAYRDEIHEITKRFQLVK
jgi:peptidyl-tRNA hydrolase